MSTDNSTYINYDATLNEANDSTNKYVDLSTQNNNDTRQQLIDLSSDLIALL